MSSTDGTSTSTVPLGDNGRLADIFERLNEYFLGVECAAHLTAALDDVGPPPAINPANGGFDGDLEYSGERLTLACRNLVVSQIAAMRATQDHAPLLDLFRRGWMGIAFPENGHMPLSCAVAWMGLDSSAGRALVAELARADAMVFPSPSGMDTATAREPLWSAIHHGDEDAARVFLAALGRRAERDPDEFHADHVSELLGEAAHGNESSPLFHRLAHENPELWADAGSESIVLLFDLWKAGENALAATILNAAPNKAIRAMSRLNRQDCPPLEAAIAAKMDNEPTIEAFDALSRAIDGLASGSLSPKASGENPLHFLTQRFPKRISSLAPKLISLGASPREKNADGATPIGFAAERLSWPELQTVFNASPQDILDSTQMFSGDRINGLVAATRSPPRGLASDETAFADNAERVAGILQAANQGSAPIPLVILMQCAQSAAFRGLAKGFEIMAREMIRRNRPIPPSIFWEYAQGSPVNAAREAGMRDCVSIATGLGMNIDGNAMLPPETGLISQGTCSDSTPEAKSLIYLLAETIQDDSAYRRTKNKDIKNERAEHLLALGADPRHPGPGEERITEHACWLDEFDDTTRDLIQKWISQFEDRQLRNLLDAKPTLDAEPTVSETKRARRRTL